MRLKLTLPRSNYQRDPGSRNSGPQAGTTLAGQKFRPILAETAKLTGQAASTVIRRACTTCFFGITTSRIPFEDFAVMLSASADSGRLKRR